jgi:monooxygenase
MTHAGTLPEHVDVLLVGAGISGIGMAHYLTTDQPSRSFALVDSRDAIGGTWDLFRYPGIRSDSDLHTFGYEFKPWTSDNAIADAHEILAYLREVIEEDDLTRRIHLGYKVIRAEWSSGEQRWTVTVQTAWGEQALISCSFLVSATGYYDYADGHSPAFPHSDEFKGRIVHPQHWPEDLDYAGKNVVVIGSGATAVTLIPAMAEKAAHITMLQRSPSYVLSIPKQDPIANGLRRRLPDKLAYRITRGFNVRRQQFIFYMAQRRPDLVRKAIRSLVARALPDGYDVDTHFNPRYKPWDQRLCMVPDGDLFAAIRDGKASVETDHIDRFTETGILLASGKRLEADIIVTATGLKVLLLGGIELQVDGEPVVTNETMVYKSMMLSGVPNFAFLFGYTNISWTLKVDVVASHLMRLLNYMDRRGYTTVTPVNDDPTVTTSPLLDFGAGYVQRVLDELPRRGSHGPWTVEYYALDRKRLTGPVADTALRFSGAPSRLPGAVAATNA